MMMGIAKKTLGGAKQLTPCSGFLLTNLQAAQTPPPETEIASLYKKSSQNVPATFLHEGLKLG